MLQRVQKGQRHFIFLKVVHSDVIGVSDRVRNKTLTGSSFNYNNLFSKQRNNYERFNPNSRSD